MLGPALVYSLLIGRTRVRAAVSPGDDRGRNGLGLGVSAGAAGPEAGQRACRRRRPRDERGDRHRGGRGRLARARRSLARLIGACVVRRPGWRYWRFPRASAAAWSNSPGEPTTRSADSRSSAGPSAQTRPRLAPLARARRGRGMRRGRSCRLRRRAPARGPRSASSARTAVPLSASTRGRTSSTFRPQRASSPAASARSATASSNGLRLGLRLEPRASGRRRSGPCPRATASPPPANGRSVARQRSASGVSSSPCTPT